ncbi:uncharacterized protein EI90DRAFT_3017449 [Cantharellus anzutake]|uniref:uncharacterized protein n=1 Tax=Cantharellus anzutake TaxID=1750568 RepID=UPI0019087348|nr:uncharacterized protein EI90DRAFT_3017449 [Cantharellus anzutake]KAF8328827.1 hypothetical protein EI90DRAFT_3017449 [Cantharellus anzutake]
MTDSGPDYLLTGPSFHISVGRNLGRRERDAHGTKEVFLGVCVMMKDFLMYIPPTRSDMSCMSRRLLIPGNRSVRHELIPEDAESPAGEPQSDPSTRPEVQFGAAGKGMPGLIKQEYERERILQNRMKFLWRGSHHGFDIRVASKSVSWILGYGRAMPLGSSWAVLPPSAFALLGGERQRVVPNVRMASSSSIPTLGRGLGCHFFMYLKGLDDGWRAAKRHGGDANGSPVSPEKAGRRSAG